MTIWLSLDELAAYIKKPKSTLYKLLQRGKLPGHKVGRSWRFDREEVDTWIKEGGFPRSQAKGRGNKK
jgi:excisionase family DNA binding protein